MAIRRKPPIQKPEPVAKVVQEDVQENPELTNVLYVAGSSKKESAHVSTPKGGMIDVERKATGRAKRVVYTMLAGTALIAGIGTYNALQPGVSTEDVKQQVKAFDRGTGFPLQKGEAFVTGYVESYLTINTSADEANFLSKYFTSTTGKTTSGSVTLGRSASANFLATVVGSPVVYSSTQVSPDGSSANYVVGAKVHYEPKSSEDKSSGSVKDLSSDEFVYYSVNVYYDSATQGFAIVPGSTSVVPAPNVIAPASVPTAKALGSGEENKALATSNASVIEGYIKGFMTASVNNKKDVEAFVIQDNPPIELFAGFNGQYSLDETNPMSYKVYPTDDSASTLKVRVTFNTVKTLVAKNTKVTDNDAKRSDVNTYVMTLVKSGDTYRVAKFAPELYAPGA